MRCKSSWRLWGRCSMRWSRGEAVRRPDATDADRPVNADGAPVDALPAQGAAKIVGGVGVPLDEATRLSAAGALTWWHLDDCGEFPS